jgi:alpha-N-arabinofuranosidase
MAELGSDEIGYRYSANYKEVPQKNAYPQSGNFGYTVKFDKELDPSMLFLRTVDSSSFSIDKNTGLTLKLKPETCMELGNPSFIGKRQQHIYATAETELTFSAANENEKAGLAIFQDEKHFYFLCKSADQGKPVLQLFQSNAESGNMDLLASAPLAVSSKKVMLRIQAAGEEYSFSYALAPDKWSLLKDKVDGKWLSTQVAGGFLGSVFGLYATSSGKETINSASFAFLKYAGNDRVYNQLNQKASKK